MQQPQPLVSVGLPVHNGARHLDQSITTILAQDLADLELMVSDNWSADAIPEMAGSCRQPDHRSRELYLDPTHPRLTVLTSTHLPRLRRAN